MKRCKKIRSQFPCAYYQELAGKERQCFYAHLSACEECEQLFREYQNSVALLNNKKRPVIPSGFWEQTWRMVEERIQHSLVDTSQRASLWERLLDFVKWQPKQAFQFAGAVALLLLGILIGRYVIFPHDDLQKLSQTPIGKSDELLARRTVDYLQRSEILLLGLVNFDPKTDDLYAIDLPHQKRISRELVTEAGYLKDQISASHQDRLIQLINDLEVILLQIANLESEYNLPAIDMVKDGVERKGILLRINVEQMREMNSFQDKKINEESEDVQIGKNRVS